MPVNGKKGPRRCITAPISGNRKYWQRSTRCCSKPSITMYGTTGMPTPWHGCAISWARRRISGTKRPLRSSAERAKTARSENSPAATTANCDNPIQPLFTTRFIFQAADALFTFGRPETRTGGLAMPPVQRLWRPSETFCHRTFFLMQTFPHFLDGL